MSIRDVWTSTGVALLTTNSAVKCVGVPQCIHAAHTKRIRVFETWEEAEADHQFAQTAQQGDSSSDSLGQVRSMYPGVGSE